MSSIQKNLTEGSVAKRLISFALPIVLSNIIQSLYNIADMVIVGQFASSDKAEAVNVLSGVNIGGQLTFIITNLVIGLSVGGSICIGQFIGANKREELKKTVSTLFTVLLFAAVGLTVIMLALRIPLLKLIKTPPEAFGYASDYFIVTIIGLIFIFTYNSLSGIMRGMGNSRIPLLFVAIACCINVVLDLLFVAVFGWKARGAAVATVISQAVSVILCIIYLKRRNFLFDFKPKSFKIDRTSLKMIMRVGIPTSVQHTVTSFSFLFLTTISNSLGVTVSAAIGSVGKFNAFALLPAIAMNMSVSAVASQNIGAGQTKRAVQTLYIGTIIGWAFSALIFVYAQLWPESILKLFNNEPDYVVIGTNYLKIFSIDYLIAPILFTINGFIVATGHTLVPLSSSILAAIVARVPAAYILAIALDQGVKGIALANPIATVTALLFSLIYYLSGKWKTSTILKNGM